MSTAYEYELIVRLRSGREEVVRLWAWHAMDAVMAAVLEVSVKVSDDEAAGMKVVSVRPPIEACQSVEMRDVLAQLGRDWLKDTVKKAKAK